MASTTYDRSSSSTMVEMPESTFYHQTCQSSEAEKTYFIYYWYPKKPPVPAWTKSAAFPGLKDQLEDRYGSVFKRYLDETCDLLASNNAVYNLELKSEEPYNVLQETLKASLPDGILVKEEQPGYFRSQWPSEFMDCVTIFSLKPFGVDRAPKITCLGKRKRAGELQPWGAQHWKKAERTPAVPDKRRNLRSANKYWRCCQCDTLQCCKERKEDERCDPCSKDPKGYHVHCEHCPDGGNYKRHAVFV